MKKLVALLFLSIPALLALFAMAGGGIGEASWLGMTVDTVDDTTAMEMGIPANGGSLVVVNVEDPALSSGIIVGDIITGINGTKMTSIPDFLDAAKKSTNTRNAQGALSDVVLTVNRLGRVMTVTMPSEWVETSVKR